MGNFDVEKTIVVPDSGGSGNNFLAGMLASACQSKGLDANAVMALCGNRNGSFGNGQAVAPLNAGINSLNTEIAGIKCHLPETKVIPCGDNYVKVNTGFNIPLQVSPAAYGACGAFGGYGYPWGYGYNCGNNGGWG